MQSSHSLVAGCLPLVGSALGLSGFQSNSAAAENYSDGKVGKASKYLQLLFHLGNLLIYLVFFFMFFLIMSHVNSSLFKEDFIQDFLTFGGINPKGT